MNNFTDPPNSQESYNEETHFWVNLAWRAEWEEMNILGAFCYTGYGPFIPIAKPMTLKAWHYVRDRFILGKWRLKKEADAETCRNYLKAMVVEHRLDNIKIKV